MRHLLFITVSFLLAFSSDTSAQTLCEEGMAAEYACDGYDLYAYLPLSSIGGGDNGNDCWGWVDSASGREFVLFGRSHGLSIVEVTDPLSPVFIATLPTATSQSLWRDIKVAGDYAFIVSEAGGHGMQILELTQVLELSGFPFNISATANYVGFGNAHNLAINTETNYAYGVGTNTFGGGLHIVDISNPELPVIAGSYDGFYTHDAQPVVYSGLDADYFGKEIVFCFNGSAGIAILNAEDKTDVQLIKHVTYENSAYTHQGWVSEDHHMVYFNDELDEVYNGNFTRTYMMNVDDLDNPVIIGYYESDNTAIDHNLYTHNGKVYASNYRSGLIVSTILEDGTIEPYGFFDTYPADDETEFTGTWSNYPYFPSGTIAVSNFDGLFIIREAGIDGVESTELPPTPVLNLSPNPSSSSVLLTGNFVDCGARVYDMTGREVMLVNSIPSVNGLNLDINTLSEGTYILNVVSSKSGEVLATSKLVVSPR